MFNNLSLHSCVNIARDKLHGAVSSGARDDVRLCRWVLLKNSLTSALSRSSETPPSETPQEHISEPASSPSKAPPEDAREDEVDAFLFPDGDVFAESFVADERVGSRYPVTDDGLGSEALWLNSLLESLVEEDAETVSVVPVDDDSEYEADLASLLDLPSSEDLTASLSSAPESILLPPSPPLSPFLTSCALHPMYNNSPPVTYSVSDLNDDIDALALPDAIEDSSSDTDSESLNTPFTRSTSSFGDAHHTGQMLPARSPFVRIVGRDEDVSYSYSFHSTIPPDHGDSFEQEC